MRQTLDLREANSYVDAIHWIRSNVVLKNLVSGPVLELEILLKPGKVTLFMNPVNHYVMAFRGADKIYVLMDDGSSAFESALRKAIAGASTELLKGLSVSHGTMGLDTFGQTRSDRKAPDFTVGELPNALRLTEYSSRGKATYQTLKRPLSMLVFMLAESARMPMLERDFKNMYFGHSVFVDDAVQSYEKAIYLKQTAIKCFPEYKDSVKLAVEKLQKRSVELAELLSQIEKVGKSVNRKALIGSLISGKSFAGDQSVASQVSRFREMCKQLGFTSADAVTELISTMRNSSAVRGAKEGPISPLG